MAHALICIDPRIYKKFCQYIADEMSGHYFPHRYRLTRLSNHFLSAKEKPRHAEAIHQPRQGNASAYSKRYGHEQKEHPRRLEGEQEKKTFGQESEHRREQQDGERISSDEAGHAPHSVRQMQVSPLQQADAEEDDAHPAQLAPVQIVRIGNKQCQRENRHPGRRKHPPELPAIPPNHTIHQKIASVGERQQAATMQAQQSQSEHNGFVQRVRSQAVHYLVQHQPNHPSMQIPIRPYGMHKNFVEPYFRCQFADFLSRCRMYVPDSRTKSGSPACGRCKPRVWRRDNYRRYKPDERLPSAR